MMSEKTSPESMVEDPAELLLQQLLHLKQYEKPDVSRMTRSKQNIMRQVRQSQSEKRKPLLDVLALSVPWFFSEPKYGIAALLVAFVGLQYAGISSRNSSTSTGIYTTTASVASFDQSSTPSVVSNRYPNLPSNYPLFSTPEGNQSVLPASFELKKK